MDSWATKEARITRDLADAAVSRHDRDCPQCASRRRRDGAACPAGVTLRLAAGRARAAWRRERELDAAPNPLQGSLFPELGLPGSRCPTAADLPERPDGPPGTTSPVQLTSAVAGRGTARRRSA